MYVCMYSYVYTSIYTYIICICIYICRPQRPEPDEPAADKDPRPLALGAILAGRHRRALPRCGLVGATHQRQRIHGRLLGLLQPPCRSRARDGVGDTPAHLIPVDPVPRRHVPAYMHTPIFMPGPTSTHTYAHGRSWSRPTTSTHRTGPPLASYIYIFLHIHPYIHRHARSVTHRTGTPLASRNSPPIYKSPLGRCTASTVTVFDTPLSTCSIDLLCVCVCTHTYSHSYNIQVSPHMPP